MIRQSCQRLDGQGATAQRLHAPVNCRGGFAGQLLVDNGASDELEMGALGHRAQAARADLLDHASQDGIDLLQMIDSLSVHGEERKLTIDD